MVCEDTEGDGSERRKRSEKKVTLTKNEKMKMTSEAVRKSPEDFEPAKEIKYGRYYPLDAYFCTGGRVQVDAYCICTPNESSSIFFLGSETTMGCEASDHVTKHCQEYLVDETEFFDETERAEDPTKSQDEKNFIDADDIPCC